MKAKQKKECTSPGEAWHASCTARSVCCKTTQPIDLQNMEHAVLYLQDRSTDSAIAQVELSCTRTSHLPSTPEPTTFFWFSRNFDERLILPILRFPRVFPRNSFWGRIPPSRVCSRDEALASRRQPTNERKPSNRPHVKRILPSIAL